MERKVALLVLFPLPFADIVPAMTVSIARLFCFSFIFAGLSSLAYGQINVDSVLAIAETIEEDGDRRDFLDDVVAPNNFRDFDDPVMLVKEQLALAKKLNSFQDEVIYALDLITSANFVAQFALADSLSLHYVTRVEDVESLHNKIYLYHEAAKSAFFNQIYDQGIHYDTLALELVSGLRPPAFRDSMAAELYNFLGKSYNASGQFVPAALVLTKGIDLIRARTTPPNVLNEMYTELGIVYSQIGLYDQAVEYLDKTTATSKSVIGIAGTQTNIGRNLLLTNNYPAAKDRYLKVLTYDLPPSAQGISLTYAYNGLVEAFYRMKNQDSLNLYYQQYTSLLEENPELREANGFLYRQSTFLYQLTNNRLNEAQATGEALYQEAIEKNDPAEQLMYTEFLSDLYKKQGNYRAAEQYTRALMTLKDSIQGANRNNALLLYYNQFETKEKENEILRLDAERQQATASRRLFQTAAGLLGLLLLMGLFFFLRLRKARQKLAAQNDELNELNATKDRFFGIIAHDLRNPIVALSTAGNQVNRLFDRGKTDAVKRVVGNISGTADRLNGLLDNLLQWALSQSGAITLKKERLSLTKIMENNLALYAPAAREKDIDLRNEVPEGTYVNADHNALQTILRNLLGNAVKFTPAGQQSVVTLSHRQEGKMDIITVSDQGKGVSEEDQQQLFSLHRGRSGSGRRKSGTGLGLILCRDLAELHGGRIELDSKAGEGARFSVLLPRG